jgi:hypothetical protein
MTATIAGRGKPLWDTSLGAGRARLIPEGHPALGLGHGRADAERGYGRVRKIDLVASLSAFDRVAHRI